MTNDESFLSGDQTSFFRTTELEIMFRINTSIKTVSKNGALPPVFVTANVHSDGFTHVSDELVGSMTKSSDRESVWTKNDAIKELVQVCKFYDFILR